MSKVYGVGVNDLRGWTNSSNPARRWIYNEWKAMIRRCYYEPHLQAYPTYRGCTVCDRWLRFSNFVADASKLPGFDQVVAFGFKGMSLDKDMLVVGNKEYSPDTCQWITRGENARDAIRRTGHKSMIQKIDYESLSKKVGVILGRPVVVVFPDGTVSEYYGTKEVERQIGVDNGTVSRCCHCKYGSHSVTCGKFKGYSFYWKEEYDVCSRSNSTEGRGSHRS